MAPEAVSDAHSGTEWTNAQGVFRNTSVKSSLEGIFANPRNLLSCA